MFTLHLRNAIGELHFIAETDHYDDAYDIAQDFEDKVPNTKPNTLYWYEDADGDLIAEGRFDCKYIIHWVRLEEITFDEGDDLFDDLEVVEDEVEGPFNRNVFTQVEELLNRDSLSNKKFDWEPGYYDEGTYEPLVLTDADLEALFFGVDAN